MTAYVFGKVQCRTCGEQVTSAGFGRSQHQKKHERQGIAVPVDRVAENRERFDALTCPEPNSGCLLWMGSIHEHGYGQLRFLGRTSRAHRVAWILFVGEIPSRLNVLHSCDVPSCVNVRHLFLGTQADNLRDMRAKGRQGTRQRRAA